MASDVASLGELYNSALPNLIAGFEEPLKLLKTEREGRE